jgi:hypothetical protein
MLTVEHTIYFVWYTPEGARQPKKSRFRMTPEEAAKRYGGMRYELSERDKIHIAGGEDIYKNSTSWLSRPKE